MERRGQDRRDVGIPNSTSNYNPPQIIHESPVKLPLAPIVFTPQDRRGFAPVSTRRGTSIFSPTQTLDHPLLLHHHRREPPPPPPQQPQLVKVPTPDPDPLTPTADGGASNSKTPASPPQPLSPPPPPPASNSNNTVYVRYRECLKNHAASMGGHVVDGCGEFMPGGEDGTADALRCAACDCHRNFHRKEMDGEPQPSNHYPSSGNNNHANRGPLIHTQTPAGHHSYRQTRSYTHAFAAGPTPPSIVNFGGGGGAGEESSSEDLNMFGGGSHAEMQPSKKRFRTKFSHEQKERMQELAEKLGWRIQKQDEEQVQKLCNETGVKRQVFKVWMHNNKQAMKKRQI